MLLDICEVETPGKSKNDPGRTLTMLVYSTASAAWTTIFPRHYRHARVVNAEEVRAGFPCSARYQPEIPRTASWSPRWSGLRAGLPVLPAFEDPDRWT